MFCLLVIQLVVAGVPAPSSCGDHGPRLARGIVTGALGKGRQRKNSFNATGASKMEQNIRNTACQDRPPIPSEAQTHIPKATSHRLNNTPASHSICSQEEGNLPKAQFDQCKWKKNSEGEEECATIKMMAKNNAGCEGVTYHLSQKGSARPQGSCLVTIQQQDNERE